MSHNWHGRVPINNRLIIRHVHFTFFLFVAFTNVVHGQTGLVPNPNTASPFQNRLTLQNPGDNAVLMVHRDPLGRACLNIEAASRQHIVNPNVYDHVVSIYNQCLKTIDIRVCYYHSEHCIDVKVLGSQRKDEVLGIYPNMKEFRFSYQEKF